MYECDKRLQNFVFVDTPSVQIQIEKVAHIFCLFFASSSYKYFVCGVMWRKRRHKSNFIYIYFYQMINGEFCCVFGALHGRLIQLWCGVCRSQNAFHTISPVRWWLRWIPKFCERPAPTQLSSSPIEPENLHKSVWSEFRFNIKTLFYML